MSLGNGKSALIARENKSRLLGRIGNSRRREREDNKTEVIETLRFAETVKSSIHT